jgi:hypothetical protein
MAIKSTIKSTNDKHTEYIHVFAMIDIDGPDGSEKKEITLVEGVERKATKEVMKKTLAKVLNNHDLKSGIEAFLPESPGNKVAVSLTNIINIPAVGLSFLTTGSSRLITSIKSS